MAENAPNTSMTLATPTSNGVLTGVSVQGHAAPGIEKLAAQAYRSRCQATTRSLIAQKKQADAAVTDAKAAYDKAVAAISVPEDFVKDLVAVVTPLRAFFPDVVATNAGDVPFVKEKKRRSKKAAAVTASADTEEDVDDEVTPSVSVHGTQYTVTGKLRSGGRTLTTVSRSYDVPTAVIEAAKTVVETHAEVARIDRDMAHVRTEMTKAADVGELAAANMVATQLSESEEGRKILREVRDMVDKLGNDAGLDETDYVIGTKSLPPAAS